MADSSSEVPPVPVPPVEPTPRAPRAKKPAAAKEEPAAATVIPPIVDLAGAPSAAPTAPPVQPEQPNPYVQPNPYAQPTAAPSAPPAYAAQPQYYGGPVLPKTLSIVSMILGIAGVLFLGPLGGIPAVITGHMAQKQQPYAKGFWITGLITGYIAILWGLLVIVIVIGIFAAAASDPYGYGYY